MAKTSGSKREEGFAPLISRRSFLELGAASTLLPGSVTAAPSARTREILPGIPSLADLGSDWFMHRFIALYAVAAAQNEWGYLKVTNQYPGLRAFPFPPLPAAAFRRCPGAPDSF